MKVQPHWYPDGTKDPPTGSRTVRAVLKDRHLEDAKRLARSKPERPLFWADERQIGLVLRVWRGNVTWIIKHKGRSRLVGALAQVTLDGARKRAQGVKDLMAAGIDPAPYLQQRAAGTKDPRAREIAKQSGAGISDPSAADGPPGWNWEQLVREYVEGNVALGRLVKDRRKVPSEHSLADVRKTFSLPEVAVLHGKRLAQIKRADIEAVSRAIREHHSPWAQRKFIAYTKAAFKWANREAGLAGIEEVRAWWLQLVTPPINTPPREKNYLTIEEIGRLLAVAEVYRCPPGRTLDRPTSEIALCSLWWLALSAQRRRAGLAPKRHCIVSDPMQDGWSIVAFPAEVMKSRRPHSLPLPPAVTALVRRAEAATPRDSQWLFPSERGIAAKEDPHVTDSIVTAVIRRLRGEDKWGRSHGGQDLLEGIPPFSPQAFRRSFATELTRLTIRGDAISAVLDHDMPPPESRFDDRSNNSRDGMEARITALAYNKSQRIELKRTAMEAWVTHILEAYEAALPEVLQSLPEGYRAQPWHPPQATSGT